MKEELITLCASIEPRMANLENQIFASVPGKYSLFKAIFDDYREQIKNVRFTIERDESQVDAARATIDNIANNLSTIEAKFDELSAVNPLNMSLLASEEEPTVQDSSVQEMAVPEPQIEMPSIMEGPSEVTAPPMTEEPQVAMPEVVQPEVETPQPVMPEVPQTAAVPNVTEGEIDDLLNSLNNSGLETVYPQEQALSSENVANVADAFSIKPQ